MSNACVRVFVPTYRRSALLRRALASLRAQTFGAWVCEVHNDDPHDDAPAAIVSELGDPRIVLVRHERNLGALDTFNLFFRAAPEPYYSLLEDDNAWEPDFLLVLTRALQEHPQATVAWCNQRVWREEVDGSWTITGETVRPLEPGLPRLIPWGAPEQALGGLHANGAMLVRSRPGEHFVVRGVPFTGIEAARERLFPHPMVYVPQPLARFAMTRESARSRDLPRWLAFQTILLATFVRHAGLDAAGRAALLAHYRRGTPPPTTAFFCAALACRECRPFLALLQPREWWRLGRAATRRPLSWWRATQARRLYPEWWKQLDRATAARFAEARVASAALSPTR